MSYLEIYLQIFTIAKISIIPFTQDLAMAVPIEPILSGGGGPTGPNVLRPLVYNVESRCFATYLF